MNETIEVTERCSCSATFVIAVNYVLGMVDDRNHAAEEVNRKILSFRRAHRQCRV